MNGNMSGGQLQGRISWRRLPAAALALASVLSVLTAPSAQAQKYSVLLSFTGTKDGGSPYGALLRDAAGNLYGTTFYGGDMQCPGTNGCGVVFRLNAADKDTVLYSFAGKTSGGDPVASLIRDSAGNLYGTALTGGDLRCGGGAGCGVVFKLSPDGVETVLHTFEGGQDGQAPYGALLRDSAGNLYGTTFEGGNACGPGAAACGTVFKLDAAGNETVLYKFTGGTDGGAPLGGLIQDAEGNFYGSTELGGDLTGANGSLGCGVVFKLDPAGKETVLYSFTGGVDGSEAGSTLVRDAAGNLYGTTGLGGDLACDPPYGCGVVFKLDSTGKETVLYSFTGQPADGWNPIAGLVRDPDGNLYGTTYRGGPENVGTVFEVDAAGKETLLYSFTGQSDGGYPYAGLIRDSSGNLYGTAVAFGASGCQDQGCGVVFKVAKDLRSRFFSR
jgi:uncharacterized repeat protein (TIGR03803 family)